LKHIVEEYLAVSFWAGPDPIPISQAMTVTLLLPYAPDPMYHHVVSGAEFTIREGPKVIGHGTVLRRWTEKAELGAAPNCGPVTPNGNSNAQGGPQSVT